MVFVNLSGKGSYLHIAYKSYLSLFALQRKRTDEFVTDMYNLDLLKFVPRYELNASHSEENKYAPLLG